MNKLNQNSFEVETEKTQGRRLIDQDNAQRRAVLDEEETHLNDPSKWTWRSVLGMLNRNSSGKNGSDDCDSSHMILNFCVGQNNDALR